MSLDPRDNPVLITASGAVIIILISFSFWNRGYYHPSVTYTPAQEEKKDSPAPPPTPKFYTYIEVVDSCGPYYDGPEPCVNMRSGPGTEYPVILKLRTGIVLKTDGTLTAGADGQEWYKVTFNEWLRYPERVEGDHYVAAAYVRSFQNEGVREYTKADVTSSINTKYIVVDRSEQTLYAYDEDVLFMQEKVSTGLEFTPTPRGIFTVYRKSPTRYMQGPVPDVSEDFYDLPGVPWNLYFTLEGGVIHGAYWHDKFGQPWSHGCVNLPPDKAQILYNWATVGTEVLVQD